MAPQHHWGPSEMVWTQRGKWREAPHGLTVIPEHDHDKYGDDEDDHAIMRMIMQ